MGAVENEALQRCSPAGQLVPGRTAAAAVDDALNSSILPSTCFSLSLTPLLSLWPRAFHPPTARSSSRGGATRDLALLPRRIILVRHAESKGNVDPFQVCLGRRLWY